MHLIRTWTARCPVALSFALAAVSLQAAPDATRQDPADPRAAVPALSYQTSLGSYRRLGDQPVGSWRALNDQVRAVGGWRAYAREASAPEGNERAATDSSPKDAEPARATSPATPGAHGAHSGGSKER